MDEENQAGTKGIELAASKGIAVVVMEPLRGGKLGNPVKEVTEVMEKHGYKETLANLALQWVWNHPEVSVVLSGMSTMEQVQENLASASRSSVGAMSKNDLALVKEIEAVYRQRAGIPCTSCGYCMPCPQGVDIPRMFSLYNESVAYNYFVESHRIYGMFGGTAGKCVQCKECEGKCPQTIPISEWMEKIKGIFEPA